MTVYEIPRVIIVIITLRFTEKRTGKRRGPRS